MQKLPLGTTNALGFRRNIWSPSEQKVFIGYGADNYMEVYLNGEKITTRME